MAESSGEYQSEFVAKIYTPTYVDEKLIGKEDEKWEDSLAHAVKKLHDGVGRTDPEFNALQDTGKPPKIIFVTATTAIPYSIAVKEAWRTAYPEEKPPKFYFVDISPEKSGYKKEDLYRIYGPDITSLEIDRLREIGERNDALENVAVFDEFYNSGETIEKTGELLTQAGYLDVNFLIGRWGHGLVWSMSDETKPVVRNPKLFGKKGTTYRRLQLQVTDESKRLTGDMREIGRRMGGQIRKHLQPAAA